MDNSKFCDDNHHEPWALELNEFFEKTIKIRRENLLSLSVG